MKCRTGNGSWAPCFWLAFFLLAGFCSAGAQVQPTSDQPSPGTNLSAQPMMPSWDDLEAASAELSSKASDLVPQVVDLNSQLGKLQSSLLDCTTLLAQSLSMRKQEALAAQGAVKSALNRSLWWQRSALVVGGAFAGYLAYKWPGSGYGAAAGAAIDAVLEISGAIRIKL